MQQKKPTIYDVAAAAGVSKSLASRALRGEPRVSEASRAAVREASRTLGYRPSRAASALASHRTKTVGLLIDDYTNLWFVELARGLHEVLDSAGYRLTVVDVATSGGVDQAADALLASNLDGVVVAMDVPDALIGPQSPPVVIAGTREHIPQTADAVANDDLLGARLAIEHLLALGHTRIAHLPAASGAGQARAQSTVSVLAERGLSPILAEMSPNATQAEAYVAALALLREHPRITAIFAANDMMAIGALGAARELGIDVPRGLSIVGYDNSELAETRILDLTTVDDMSRLVGGRVGRLLMTRMLGEGRAPTREQIEPHLVVRGTTTRPRREHSMKED